MPATVLSDATARSARRDLMLMPEFFKNGAIQVVLGRVGRSMAGARR